MAYHRGENGKYIDSGFLVGFLARRRDGQGAVERSLPPTAHANSERVTRQTLWGTELLDFYDEINDVAIVAELLLLSL